MELPIHDHFEEFGIYSIMFHLDEVKAALNSSENAILDLIRSDPYVERVTPNSYTTIDFEVDDRDLQGPVSIHVSFTT